MPSRDGVEDAYHNVRLSFSIHELNREKNRNSERIIIVEPLFEMSFMFLFPELCFSTPK